MARQLIKRHETLANKLLAVKPQGLGSCGNWQLATATAAQTEQQISLKIGHEAHSDSISKKLKPKHRKAIMSEREQGKSSGSSQNK